MKQPAILKISFLISLCLNIMLITALTVVLLHNKYAVYNVLTSGKHFRYVMLGNSITEGCKWHRKLFMLNIRNCGTAGHTTTHMVWELYGKVIAASPEKCFLMGGVNDINWGVPLSRVRENYRSIIDTLLGHNIEPVIQSTLYASKVAGSSTNQSVDSLNSYLKELAQLKAIDFIDLNALLSENHHLKSEYTFDGIHLNKAAYDAWMEALETYLQTHEKLP